MQCGRRTASCKVVRRIAAVVHRHTPTVAHRSRVQVASKRTVIVRAAVAKSSKAIEPLQVEESSDGGLVRMTITVPKKRVAKISDKVVVQMREQANMPGFKDNTKIPLDMLMEAVGGEERFKYACIEAIMDETMEEAFSGRADELVDGSQKVESDAKALLAEFARDKEFTYVVTADTGASTSNVSFAGPYTGFSVEVPAVLDDETEQKALDEGKRRFLKEAGGDYSIVSDRGLQVNDIAVVSFEAFYTPSNEPIENMNRKKLQIEYTSEDAFFPTVLPKMEGMKVGDTRTIPFTFPQEWDPVELSGVTAEVTVTLNELFEWQLPSITLDMVKSMYPTIESLEDFDAKMREAVQYDAQSELVDRIHAALAEKLETIIEDAPIPEEIFQAFALGEYEKKLKEAIAEGVLEQDQLETLASEEVANEFIEQEREMLERKFRVLMALEAIFERENLEVDDAMVDQQLEQLKAEYAETESDEELDWDQIRNYLYGQSRLSAAMCFVQDAADVKIIPVSEQTEETE